MRANPTQFRPVEFLTRLLEPWFPVECGGCGRPGSSPCRRCLDALAPSVDGPVPSGLDSMSALVTYDEVSGPLIAAVKQRGEVGILRSLSPAMAMLLPADLGGRCCVTWAPTTDRRRRERGFDQAEVIARVVARTVDQRSVRLLRRMPGPHQTGRDRSERLHGVRFEPSGRIEGPVVVIDDVITTGATLSAASDTLRMMGADAVHGLALARTPDHHAI